MEGEPPYLQGAVTKEVVEGEGFKEFWAGRPKHLGLAPSLSRKGPGPMLCAWEPFVLGRLQSESSV